MEQNLGTSRITPKKKVGREEEITKTFFKKPERSSLEMNIDVIREVSHIPIEKAGSIHLSFKFMSDIIRSIRGDSHYRAIPFLIGPPGTGKTFFSEVLTKTVFEKLKDLATVLPVKESMEEFKSRIDTAKGIGLINGINQETVDIIANNYGNKHLVEILDQSIEMYRIKSDEEKETLRILLHEFLLDLTVTDRKIMEPIYKKELQTTHVYVLPAQETATELVLTETYKTGGESVVSREESAPILSLIKDAWEGDFVLLTIDEVTETLKRDPERRAKELHAFFDSYLNNTPFSIHINLEEASGETQALIDYLKEKGVAKDDGSGNFQIQLPPTLFIFTTGNVRAENAPIGLTQSTWERLTPYPMTYPDPEIVDEFLNKKAETIIQKFKELNISLNTLKEFPEFVNELSLIYKKLYDEYIEKPEEFRSRMLPSYRNLDGAIKAFLAYSIAYDYLRNNYGNMIDQGIRFGKVIVTPQITISGSESYAVKTIDNSKEPCIPTVEEMGKFLCAMVCVQTYIKVGSYTEVSEGRGSEMIETILTEQTMKLLNTIIGLRIEDLFYVSIGDKTLYYSYPYFLYLLYMATSVVAGQKFFLLTGTTQEGKSTMVDSGLRYFANALVNPLVVSTLNAVRFLHITDKSDATLIAPKIKDQAGKPLKTPLLREIVEEANKNRSTLYLVLIDEIDALQFSQHLNHLMTRDIIEIDGVEYYVGNVCLLGTSNVSTIMLDNFISRSILPLLFLREIGNAIIPGIGIDARSLALIHNTIADIASDEAQKDDMFRNIVSEAANDLEKLEFYEVVRVVETIKTTIKLFAEKGLTQEIIERITGAFQMAVKQKEMRRSMSRGGAV